jgi:hypothetical protein
LVCWIEDNIARQEIRVFGQDVARAEYRFELETIQPGLARRDAITMAAAPSPD